MSTKLYDAAFGITSAEVNSISHSALESVDRVAHVSAFPSLLSFADWGEISDMGRIYLVLSAFVLAYIIKLLMAEGWPSFVIERDNEGSLFSPNGPSNGPNVMNPQSADVTIYMGTVKRGLGLKYVVNLQERRFAISFVAKYAEGKMLMMMLCFPFSIFITIVIGIMIDAGELMWTVRCDPFVDTFGTMFDSLLRRE